MMIPQTGDNGAKPRFDGGGTEFGLMHRDLGSGYNMFDIDRISASLEVDLQLRRENEGFVEYRINKGGVKFAALFEVKAVRTSYSAQALSSEDANSKARAELARLIGARLFVVFGTDGHQPFAFYEINTGTLEVSFLGTLDYTPDTRKEMCQSFWRDVLHITRYF